MSNFSKLKVVQTSPTTWDVFLDDKKLDSVRSLLLNMAVDRVPRAFIEVLLNNTDIETTCKVENDEQ